MSMTKEYIKKFVEEDYKDCLILIICDNEHKFYHNAKNNPPIIWDWDNDVFIALETNNDIIDQYGHSLQVTTVALEEIQFLTASVDIVKALEFVEKNITDEDKKKEVMEIIKKIGPSMMTPKSIRTESPSAGQDGYLWHVNA